MNWEEAYRDCCEIHKVGDDAYFTAVASNRHQEVLNCDRARNNIRRAMHAVKTAHENNPFADAKTLRKESLRLITGNPVFVILLQVLLSATIKLAIDYFISKLFVSKVENAALHLPSK
jgi:hypothetical protein